MAAVFAIHPLRVESVAWVAERKDVLSGLFFMLTLWFYARYADRPFSWGRYLLVVVSFALGLAAKPMLVTLPFVLLLLDYWPLGRMSPDRVGGARGSFRDGALREPVRNSDKRSQGFDSATMGTWCPNPPFSERFAPRTPTCRLVVEKIPLFVLVAASCAVTLAAQRDAMKSLAQVAFAGRVAHAVMGYVAYLGKMLYPAGLAVFYPLPKDPPPVLELAAAASVLLAISAAAFVARRKCPYLLFGWLWYLGTLVPVIGLVQVGNQAMADRYTYLTQIGLYAAFAWGGRGRGRAWKRYRWPATVVSALVMAGLIVMRWQQTRYWYDSETLWTRALACSSQNPLAYTSLGNALAGRRRVDEAIAQYRKALEIEPGHAGAHTNLGNALAGRGELDEAMAHYRKALEIEPDHVEAHNDLGNALSNHGEVEAAIAHYRMALAIKADFVEAHNNLGTALARHGVSMRPWPISGRPWRSRPWRGNPLQPGPSFRAPRKTRWSAREFQEKALALASAQNDRDLADAIRAEMRRTNRLRPAATHRKGRQRSKKCKRSAEGCQDAYNTAGFRSTQALPGGLSPPRRLRCVRSVGCRGQFSPFQPRRRCTMAISIKKVTLWRTEVENKPGALSSVLAPLAEVGADLQVVMGYRYPGEEHKAAIEVCPVSGKKPTIAASKAGLAASAIPTLLVHGDNRPGLGHAIAPAIAEAGINVMFLVAQVIDTRFSAVMGFEEEEDVQASNRADQESRESGPPRTGES